VNVKLPAVSVGLALGLLALGFSQRMPAGAWVAWTPLVATAAGSQEPFDYDDYAAALSAHVDGNGMIDYRGLKADPGKLNAYVSAIGRVGREQHARWSDEEKVAFWLNAYNGITLKIIIDRYPIQPTFPARLYYPSNSIRQIEGVWDEIEFRVIGKNMTLEAIEHEILRKEFNEPRIHMALVCAAMGCPPIRNEPYTGGALDEQLDDQSKRFVASSAKFRIDRRKGRVHLSPIFDWFGEDFLETYGTSRKFRGHSASERAVLNYLSRYLSTGDRQYLESEKYKVKYLDYDWSLNEQKRRRAS
jgi:hypothetical protein